MTVEYLVTNGGTPAPAPKTYSVPPFFWNDTPIGVDPPTPLIGFSIGVRPYTEVTTPNEDPLLPDIVTREYPSYYIKSQTLTPISHTPPIYTTDTGSEIFTAPVTPENSPVTGSYSTAGITNGTAYSYPKVFDQTNFRYIERDYVPPAAPPPVDDSVEGNFPLEPYDPSAGLYPYSTITTYVPDTRDVVTVTYTLTTKYSMSYNGSEITEVATITQDVLQTINDWTDECRFYLNRGSYYNGVYNESVT